MKRIFTFFTIATAVVGFSTTSYAQPVGSTATATATATIITPISITKDVDMNFGDVAVTSAGGTVVLATDGSRSLTGGVKLPVIAGTVTAASFTVSGLGDYAYTITLPSIDLIITSGTNTMIVNAFTSDPTNTAGAGVLSSSVAGAPGTQTVTVGATLHVVAGQPAGVYLSATPFPVTVNYN